MNLLWIATKATAEFQNDRQKVTEKAAEDLSAEFNREISL